MLPSVAILAMMYAAAIKLFNVCDARQLVCQSGGQQEFFNNRGRRSVTGNLKQCWRSAARNRLRSGDALVAKRHVVFGHLLSSSLSQLQRRNIFQSEIPM